MLSLYPNAHTNTHTQRWWRCYEDEANKKGREKKGSLVSFLFSFSTNRWKHATAKTFCVRASVIRTPCNRPGIHQSSGKIGPLASIYPSTGWQCSHPLCLCFCQLRAGNLFLYSRATKKWLNIKTYYSSWWLGLWQLVTSCPCLICPWMLTKTKSAALAKGIHFMAIWTG